MPFNIDVNPYLKSVKRKEYELLLLKPNMLPFGYIEGIFDMEFDFRMDGISRLRFLIAKYIVKFHKEIVNPFWERMRYGYLISLDNERVFIIQIPEISAGDATVQTINAYSLENELRNKLVRNFRPTDSNNVTTTYSLRNLMNEMLEEHTGGLWKISKDSDSDVLDNRLRIPANVDEQELYEFFMSIQETYRVLFEYDTSIDPATEKPRREIIVHDATHYVTCPAIVNEDTGEECGNPKIYYEDGYVHCAECGWKKSIYGKDSGLRITDRNYIKQYTERLSAPVTRLYVTGKDYEYTGMPLDIIYAHPLGQEYIEDFSFYRDPKETYMTRELLDAWDRYDEKVKAETANIKMETKRRDEANKKIVDFTYGVLDTITLEIEKLKGYLKSANSYFSVWIDEENSTAVRDQALKDANTEMKKIDDWIKGEEANQNLIKYGKSNLETLVLVYEQKINAIVELNKKLIVNKTTGELTAKPQGEITKDDGIDLTAYQNIKAKLENAIKTIEDNISEQKAIVKAAEDELLEIRSRIDKKNHFTKEQLEEMDFFINESHYRNDTIGTSAYIGSEEYQKVCEELYKDGLKALRSSSKPKIEISTDIVDFLDCTQPECTWDWGKLGLGYIITVEHQDSSDAINNFSNMLFRVIEYKHNPYQNTLSLQISNEENFKTPEIKMLSTLRGADNVSAIVGKNNTKWNNSKQSAVDKIVQDGLNLALSAIKGSDYQEVEINEQGITIGNQVESKKGRKIRIMNDGVYLTTDDFQTVKLAISPDQITAELLAGIMVVGKKLLIQATKADGETQTFEVDGEGVKLYNGSMYIKDGEDSKNGITLDPEEGLKITSTDGKSTISLNANTKASDGKNNGNMLLVKKDNTEVLAFDPSKDGTVVSPNLLVNGTIKAKDLYIQDDSVSALIDGKIKPDYLELKGIEVKKGDKTTFKVSNDGDVNVAGDIKMENGSISWDKVGAPSASQVGAIPDEDSAIQSTHISSGAVTTPKIAANAITAGKIETGAITSDKISVDELSAISANLGTVKAGSITSNTDINVGTDVSIGEKLTIDATNYGAGINWEGNNGKVAVEIFVDSASKALFIKADGGVYINNEKYTGVAKFK